jgi:3-oxoacyl-[acyl-carrier protein] reductase
MEIKQGRALVTGGSAGIGRAICIRLARDGFDVLVHYNKGRERAQETQDHILKLGGKADLIQFDVADSAAATDALESYFKSNPAPLSVLVNNAGIRQDGLLGLMSDIAFDDVIRTNVNGPFFLMRWAVRKMLRQKLGVIVNMASLAGQTGNAGQINYAASKAALIAMTKSLAMEVGSRNIRVNAVAPGLIETAMIEGVPNLEDLTKRIPLGRIGLPEDVAGAVSFLCSDDATYITGHTLSVNGGLFPS